MKTYLASPIAQTKEKNLWNESKEKLSRNKVISQKLKEIGIDVYLPQINQKKTAEHIGDTQYCPAKKSFSLK